MNVCRTSFLEAPSEPRWVATVGLPVVMILMWVSFAEDLTAQGRGFRPVDAERNHNRPAVKVALDRNRSDYQISERGAHHQVWQKVETVPDPENGVQEVVRSYTELGANLNYWDEDAQSWKQSREIIEPIPGGSIARQGGQQVKFASDLNVEGSVTILNSDGSQLRASVIGLVFRGLVSNRKVVLGKVRSTIGKIVPPNRVIYEDAFQGVGADVVYIYKRSGVVQDVILRERVGTPESFGFDPSEPVALEVVTEFFDDVQPRRVERVSRGTELAQANSGSGVQIQNEELIFEGTRFGDGIAFSTVVENSTEEEAIGVAKRWQSSGGRDLLIEAVDYDLVEAHIAELADSTKVRLAPLETRNAVSEVLDVALDSGNTSQNPMSEQSIEPLASPGFVIDYTTVSGGSFTDYKFERGKTYLINGRIYLYGTTAFEGGAVIKHNSSQLDAYGDVRFLSSAFQPVIFTSMHDDTVGALISGSSGTPPSSPYDSSALHLVSTSEQLVEHVTIKYAQVGIYAFLGGGNHTLRHIQALNCYAPLMGYGSNNLRIENVLVDSAFHGIENIPYTPAASIVGSNVTISNTEHALYGTGFELENSLIVECANVPAYVGDSDPDNVEVASATGVFQSAGGANFYLADNSPYRNIGTSQIDPLLKYELQSRSTYPPSTEYATLKTTTSDVTMTPHVPRDNDGSLDLGYHYPAVDYLVYHLNVAGGTTLSVQAGTRLAAHGQYFVIVEDSAEAYFRGTVSDPILIGWSRSILGEDSASSNPYSASGSFQLFLPFDQGTLGVGGAILHLDSVHLFAENYGAGPKKAIHVVKTPVNPGGCSSLRIRDCFFVGLSVILDDELPGHEYSVVNNMFLEGIFESRDGQQTLNFYNNEMVDSLWDVAQIAGSDVWSIHDNVFDSMVAGSLSTLTNATSSHNAYHNTSFRVQGVPDTGDVVLQTGTYFHVTGPFGDYYHNENVLLNAGSRTAAAAGLYHYTSTWPDDTKEGNSTVDIGLHYPSTTPGTGGN